jgi:flagellin
MVQTAEGAIAAASEMGQRILMLATQGANGTLGTEERSAIRSEMQQLIKSIDSIGGRTSFSGNSLLDEAATATGTKFTMQISSSSLDKVSLDAAAFRNIGLASSYSYTAYTATTLGALANGDHTVYVDVGGVKVSKTLNVTNGSTDVFKLDGITFDGSTDDLAGVLSSRTVAAGAAGQASTLSAKIDSANSITTFQDVQDAASLYVKALGTQRSLLGAYQNQMEYILSKITELSYNLQSARSRVIDTDYASETASLTKGQILQQAATAMLAQANQMPNVILTLLK